MKIKTHTIELTGTNYEIGFSLGKTTESIPILKAIHTSGFEGFNNADIEKAKILFKRWCPGLNEELQGFADALQVPLEKIFYYAMTYLRPNCSQIALLPSITQNGNPLLARNYEFNHQNEDFTLIKTKVNGKYTHMGTSVLHFGRDDGLNECGLAISMSSCGFPVGANKYMRKPKLIGLQFWAVIRTLLENCKDVKESIEFLSEMPIAYNLNLMLVDNTGNIALVETLDGHMAIKQINELQEEKFLCATNHPVLEEIIPYEPKAMRHSLERLNWIREKMNGAYNINSENLKEMLLSKYPDGLCCHYFRDFFGTTKSIIMDPVCGTIEICWGGLVENGWKKYNIQNPLIFSENDIEIEFDRFDPKLAEYITL